MNRPTRWAKLTGGNYSIATAISSTGVIGGTGGVDPKFSSSIPWTFNRAG